MGESQLPSLPKAPNGTESSASNGFPLSGCKSHGCNPEEAHGRESWDECMWSSTQCIPRHGASLQIWSEVVASMNLSLPSLLPLLVRSEDNISPSVACIRFFARFGAIQGALGNPTLWSSTLFERLELFRISALHVQVVCMSAYLSQWDVVVWWII